MLNKKISTLRDQAETAARLRVEPNTLAVWRCNGRYDLPYLKIGSKVYYSDEDIESFLESRRVQPTRCARGAGRETR